MPLPLLPQAGPAAQSKDPSSSHSAATHGAQERFFDSVRRRPLRGRTAKPPGHSLGMTEKRQITRCFHFPRRNSKMLATATTPSAITIDQ